VVFPGFDGGAEWGGPAADTETGIIYVNSNDLPWTGALAPNTGGEQSQGNLSEPVWRLPWREHDGLASAIPSLVDVGDRISSQQITGTIKNGREECRGFHLATISYPRWSSF